MSYRAPVHTIEIEIDEEAKRSLDRVAEHSGGALDFAAAARLALLRGLSELAREAEVHAARHVRVCPRCGGTALGPAETDGVLLQGCAGCGGIWVDDESSRRLIAAPSAQAARLASVASRNARQDVDTSSTVVCPVCQKTMRHQDFPNARLRLDVCDAHGSWFDKGELAALIELLRAQKNKQAELQRAIASAELEGDIRQIENLYASGYAEGYARGARFHSH